MVLANRSDCALRHTQTACTATLRAPHIHRLVLACDHHGCQHAHPHIQRALEAHIGAEMRDAAGNLRRVQEHGKRPLHRAATGNDLIEDAVVLCRHLLLACDRWKPRHQSLPATVAKYSFGSAARTCASGRPSSRRTMLVPSTIDTHL